MTKRTKSLQFSKATKQQIFERDEQCIFCKQGFHRHSTDPFAYLIPDIMHIINKSQGGLGIIENGALGCRYHHSLLDNGAKGLREEMFEIIEDYMRGLYPGWNRENLVFKK